MKKIKLILSGPGTIYPVHVGAILRLSEEGYVFSEIAASSWGSIIAAAIGTGYATNTELIKFVKQTLPVKQNLIAPSRFSLFTKWGMIRTKKLSKFLDAFFVNRLDAMKIPVNFIATNVQSNATAVFNNETNPSMKVSTAIAASMSIPMLMEPIKIDGKYYSDGAAASQFPFDLFGNENVIILQAESLAKTEHKISTIKNYIEAFVNYWIKSNSAKHIPSNIINNVIRLRTSSLPFDLTMTDAIVDRMISEGYNATDLWLKSK